MNIRLLRPSIAARLALGAACLLTSMACGGEMLRTGRAPVYLVISSLTATSGTTTSPVLRSDVINAAGLAIDDLGSASISSEAKNPAAGTAALNAVTLTRYRVAFRRSDGRNTPGVDVPYGFDGALTVTIAAGGSADVVFQIVRQQSKLEPPLRNLVSGGGQIVISTIAEVTFFGRDQNGNEVTVTGNMDVQFGDF